MMEDTFGRTITYLRLSVTDLCNYRCCYCMAPEGVEKTAHGAVCSLEELRDMTAAAVACGVRKVRITGGEPLVRRGIVELCRMVKEIPGVKELCLTTNGSLLGPLALPLREAGVDRLNISVDTLRPDRFRTITRLGELSQVWEGIQAAEAAGFSQLKLNCVLMGGVNDDEIKDFVNLTKTHPWQVRFIELMPMGVCAGWDRRAFLPVETVRERCSELEPVGTEGVASCYRAARCRRDSGIDCAHESRLLRGLQPDPDYGGREAQALSALRGGDSPAGPDGSRSGPGGAPGDCPQAGASPSGAPGRQRGPAEYE